MSPTVPMQRGGRPEEIATGVLWLLSPEASYTTGAILEIGGGR
jgi:NAD(P)-dependent dehydrogenase (short-subunit alcohol dehydrogenase family)